MQHAEAALEQNDISRVLCDIDRAGHRDPDICGVQRGGIVDSIAEKADDVTAVLQREDYAVLLRRRYAGKDIRLFGHVREGRVIQASEIVAQDHFSAVDSNLRADVPGYQFIVAGQDLDLDTVSPQGGDRLGRTLKRRIGERQESQQNQIVLVADGQSGSSIDRPVGDCQNAESLRA